MGPNGAPLKSRDKTPTLGGIKPPQSRDNPPPPTKVGIKPPQVAPPPPWFGAKFFHCTGHCAGRTFFGKKTLSTALLGDPNHQNMFRIYTTNKQYVSRDMSHPSWYMHAPKSEGSWVQYPHPEPFLALFLVLLALFFGVFSALQVHMTCIGHNYPPPPLSSTPPGARRSPPTPGGTVAK